MAPFLLAIAASLAQAKQKKDAENQARQDAVAGVHQQRAQELGYPGYGMQAAQFNRDMSRQNEGQNMIGSLLPLLFKGGGGGGQ